MSNLGSTAVGDMSGSKLGQLLQEARRQRGLEIKDIAASTHVRSEYLTALEEGRYSELPESVYTRNFLRLYADAVGLDESEVLEHYSLERYGKAEALKKSVYPYHAYDPATESYVAGGAKVAEAERVTRRRGTAWLVPLIILGLLGSGIYYAWRNFVFPVDGGGYSVSLPGGIPEFTIPSFNREGNANAGTGGTSTIDSNSNSLTAPSNSSSSTGSSQTLTGDASLTGSASGDASTGTVDRFGTDGSDDLSNGGINAGDNVLVTPTTGSTASATENSNDEGLAGAAGATGLDTTTSGTAGLDATGLDTIGLDTGVSDATAAFVLLSIVTEPEGAEVSIDNFDLGTTPITDFPITPSESKQLNISLDGYEPVARNFDGTEAQDFFFSLEEVSALGIDRTDVEGNITTIDSITINSDGTVVSTDDALADGSLEADPALNDKVVITIEDGGEAWLEVYQGSSRSGAQLVFRVANDSDRFVFDKPIFVRAGRSSLVKVSVDGAAAEPLGPPDEVAEQLFSN